MPSSSFQSNRGVTLWFTGLSGSGKSTIASLLVQKLREQGIKAEPLDGDEVRTHLSKGLSFSKEDRDINIKRIGFVCHLLTRNGVVAVAAAISPYRSTRDYCRGLIKDFIEIYVSTPVEECEKRDVKGLYKKARAGEIKEFTGLDDPYEPPLHPEVVCDTLKFSPQECVEQIFSTLEKRGYLKRVPA